MNAPDDDIKALQHSLNVLEFTDRDGKKLEENGVWGSKTEWAWNTMQGKNRDSFMETDDIYHPSGKEQNDNKNLASSVYDTDKSENVLFFDKTKEKLSSWWNKESAKAGLAATAYDQYKWMIGASLSSPIAGSLISNRISNSINSVEEYKDSINKIGKAYNVRPDIMAGIIFKEQLTQSIPDNLSILDAETFNLSDKHSVGLAAVTPKLARLAWEYVNKDFYESFVKEKDDAELARRLTDPDFNLQTLAAGLRYIAQKICEIPYEQMNYLTDEQWKSILNHYNNANNYNEKVMEYIPYINELLT